MPSGRQILEYRMRIMNNSEVCHLLQMSTLKVLTLRDSNARLAENLDRLESIGQNDEEILDLKDEASVAVGKLLSPTHS